MPSVVLAASREISASRSCQALAAEKFPPAASLEDVSVGDSWPRAFCAFEGCAWSSFEGVEEALAMHLEEQHREDLQPIVAQMVRGRAQDTLLTAYNAAISAKCRQASLDRTAFSPVSRSFSNCRTVALAILNARSWAFFSRMNQNWMKIMPMSKVITIDLKS